MFFYILKISCYLIGICYPKILKYCILKTRLGCPGPSNDLSGPVRTIHKTIHMQAASPGSAYTFLVYKCIFEVALINRPPPLTALAVYVHTCIWLYIHIYGRVSPAQLLVNKCRIDA